jgi:ParB-like chromosome segregation protein Spo0J
MIIRDRIRELRRVPARLLRPNPKNWRKHPQFQQDVLRGVLAEIGYADALLARELPDGTLELVDGHLRAETTPEADVPVLLLDLSDEEADKLLALLDPLAGLATSDAGLLGDLLSSVQTGNANVRAFLDQVAVEAHALEASEKPPPDRPEEEIPDIWQLVVECQDEADQRELFERLRSEGYKCRVLTL